MDRAERRRIMRDAPEDLAYARKRAGVAQFLAAATAGDHALGRGPQNWAQDPRPALQAGLRAFHAHDVRVFFGGGQVVLADLKPAQPVIVQRRPLAQRELALAILEGGTA